MERFLKDIKRGLTLSSAVFLLIATVVSYVLSAVLVVMALAGRPVWKEAAALAVAGVVFGTTCSIVSDRL